MLIPRFLDMNPHLSQHILNKDIFQMWIHHYTDMNPHKSIHIKEVYPKNVDTSLLDMYVHCGGHSPSNTKLGYVVYLLNVNTSIYIHESKFKPKQTK